ncbi:hypothetical protein CsatB_009368 [Cannabis sativa]|uniref:RING-CH-type domain-containing protein n=1 Tax=Cannabis sativa TaxID=3483 RepID=A0A7J6GTN7_CANSA|nr:hypothetical protein G4B88_024195 [Cannabis sativa]KAF4386151.1 hypothetical protein F8388_016403 [Cannabis sativa]
MATLDKTHVVVVDVEPEGGCRSSDEGGGGNGYSGNGVERSEEERRSQSESRAEIVEKGSPVSEHSVELDLECGGGVLEPEVKAHLAKVERDCRICHLSMDTTNHESGIPIELGCSCKEDLAAAHKQCAEAWFKIKGNKTCEICGSTAINVSGVSEAEMMEQWNDSNDTATTTPAAAPIHPAETRNFWQGHRFLNFLLACMVFAFVISWLFHFNVPS